MSKHNKMHIAADKVEFNVKIASSATSNIADDTNITTDNIDEIGNGKSAHDNGDIKVHVPCSK